MLRVLILILSLGLVAACGAQRPSSGARQEPTPTSSSAPMSSIPPPTLTRPTAPPTYPSDLLKPITVQGRIEMAAGGDCIELVTAQNVRYVLEGEAVAGVKPGDTVEVRALPAPQRESPCGGRVLLVRELRSL